VGFKLVAPEIATFQRFQVQEFVNRLQSLDVVYSLITHAPLELTPRKVPADVSGKMYARARRVNDIAYLSEDVVKFTYPLLNIPFPHRKTVCLYIGSDYLGHGVDVITPTVGVFQSLVGGFTNFGGILW